MIILEKYGKPLTRQEIEDNMPCNRTSLLVSLRQLVKHKEVKKIFGSVPKYVINMSISCRKIKKRKKKK